MKRRGRLALIDGDVVCYNAGFASDAAAREKGIEHEPLSHCLHIVRQRLDAITEAAGATDRLIYLSHPINYREEIFPDYKANRDVTHKPFWHTEIRDYLIERQGAAFSEQGDEADDALGIHQMGALAADEETIICTIDKDLDMIPGLHYNFSKTRRDNGVYDLSDPDCLRLFYTQMLTGDSADNIPGMFKKLGVKASARWLVPIEDMTRAKEMYEYVMEVYNGDEGFVHRNGKLLWIKRDERWWEPPR